MATLSEIRVGLASSTEAVVNARNSILKHRSSVSQLTQKLEDEQDPQKRMGLQRELDALNTGSKELTDAYLVKKEAAWRRKQELFAGQDIKQLVEQCDDAFPFLLFPVRIETRFIEVEQKTELWIRIYPDDIAITTHEKFLTTAEYDEGLTYWKNRWTAGNDEEQQKGLWNVLATAFGNNRASWVALNTKPQNFGDPAVLKVEDLLFTAQDESKAAPWTESPHSRMMPDCFIVTGYKGDTLVFEKQLKPVPDILAVGPDPNQIDSQVLRDAVTNQIKITGDMEWVVDFDKAVNAGMGIKIPLEAPFDKEGLDHLYVLGLRLRSSTGENKNHLADLIQNHRYSEKGFSFVPNGMATNNTADLESGFNSSDTGNENSFQFEKGDAAVVIETDVYLKSDGQRFAEALDLPFELIRRLPLADKFDVRDALAMNKALWPATLGYFLREMMNPSDDNKAPYASKTFIENTKKFFSQYVSARGHLSAFRVGAQPYGLLVTTDFRKWKEFGQLSPGLSVPDNSFNKLLAHRAEMTGILKNLLDFWNSKLSELPSVGQKGKSFEILLEVLGLQASAVEFYSRNAVDEEYEWNWLNFSRNNRIAKAWWENAVAAKTGLGEALGFDSERLPRIFELQFFKNVEPLKGPIVDFVEDLKSEVLSEEKTIKDYDGVKEHNYIYWLTNSSYEEVRGEVFKKGEETVRPPKALLYLMLRHAWLSLHTDTVIDVLEEKQLVTNHLKRDRTFHYISPQSQRSKIEYALVGAHAVIDNLSSAEKKLSIVDYLRTPAAANINHVIELNEHHSALNLLKNLSTAKLERVFTEHIDLCTYRLDAWQSGLFQERLEKLRQLRNGRPNGEDKEGFHIGAFGWVENLKPNLANRIRTDPAEIPQKLRDEVKGDFYEYLDNGGFIHGFSLNHAVTAAVLRNAYLSHAGPADRTRMSVNLTSERVRTGMNFIDGIRNGQDLPALLGYQFERGIHDHNGSLNIDPFIYKIRDRFPLISKQANNGMPDDAAIETLEARNVVDGLELLNAYRTQSYPYGIKGLPADQNSAIAKAIIAELDRMDNFMDAIGDIALSESVYQLTLGNYDRAGAMIQAFTEGNNPPEPDIIKTPRSGNVITCRTVMQFEIDPADDVWSLGVSSPLSTTEKGLNKWLAGIIGNPDDIKCRVSWIKDPVANLIQSGDVSIKDLAFHPLDLVLLCSSDVGNDSSPLEKRIGYRFRQDNFIPDNRTITIDLKQRGPAWAASVKTIFETLPFLLSLKKLVSDSRPLNASDYLLPSLGHKVNPANQSGCDADELKKRVQALHTALDLAIKDLQKAKNDTVQPFTQPMFDNYRQKLIALSLFGVEEAFPISITGFTSVQQQQLDAQAVTLIELLRDRWQKAGDKLAFVNTAPLPTDAEELLREKSRRIQERVRIYSEAAKLLGGNKFTVVPRFEVTNVSELATALSGGPNLIRYSVNDLDNPLVVDEWVQSTARVREKMKVFEDVSAFFETSHNDQLDLFPLQLPYNAADHWVAVTFPPTMTISRDYVSIVLHADAGHDFTGKQSGFLVDEWNEVIPNKEETTGIAFHFDQPNAMPPQCLLLAVTPELKGKWTWRDLMSTLQDTLQRSKQRAVEPDHISATNLAQLLPAVLTTFTSNNNVVSANFLRNARVIGQ